MITNDIHHINRLKRKIILIDVNDVFGKVQHSFLIKALRKIAIERNFLSLIKDPLYKITTNIIPDSERLKAFLLRSESRKDVHPHHMYVSVLLNILASAIRQRKKEKKKKERREEIHKVTYISKEELKLSFLADDMIVIENSKKSTKIKNCSSVSSTKPQDSIQTFKKINYISIY